MADLDEAVELLRRLKRDLMHARRFQPDTLDTYRRACNSLQPNERPAMKDELLARVYAHAKARWCWDDERMLEELYQQRYDGSVTPEAFVDALADKYDLDDPRDFF